MHSTNKAFERYFKIESDDLRDIYKDASRNEKNGKVIEIASKFWRESNPPFIFNCLK